MSFKSDSGDAKKRKESKDARKLKEQDEDLRKLRESGNVRKPKEMDDDLKKPRESGGVRKLKEEDVDLKKPRESGDVRKLKEEDVDLKKPRESGGAKKLRDEDLRKRKESGDAKKLRDEELRKREETAEAQRRKSEFLRKYKIGDVIGTGGTSRVYAATRLSDKAVVAVKKIPYDQILEWAEFQGQKEPLEATMLRNVKNVPGVIRMYEAYDQKKHFFLVLKRFEDAIDLEAHLAKIPEMPESVAQDYFKKIVGIMIACMKVGIVHRDISPQNFLIRQRTKDIILIDFGAAAYVADEPFKNGEEGVGCWLLNPPECFINNTYYSESMTVWELGILLCLLLKNGFPFITKQEILTKEEIFKKELSPNAKDLICQCLKRNAGERPRLVDLLSHPFFEQLPDEHIPHT